MGNKWQGTRREPDVLDAIRVGMMDDRDPFREAVERATGLLVLVQADDPDWIELEGAARRGDILAAAGIRDRMVVAGKLTITTRFHPA